MKYFIGAICVIILSMAFGIRKCEHVFTQIEQANIKIERPNLYGGVTLPCYAWPTGLEEGKEIICVKCFYETKQILDYGPPAAPTNLWPEGLTGSLLICDTVSSAIAIKDGRFIKVDSLHWVK